MRSVLFDLDGTLADTAPDLGYAVNQQRLARGMPELSIAELRAYASSGARGLLQKGFGIQPADSGYRELRDEFLLRSTQAPASPANSRNCPLKEIKESLVR